MTPQDSYFRDLAVYLGFRTARAELDVARNIEDTERAADTLWRTALRAEYGGAADARRALEEAQRQLAQALAEGAPPERIRQLMDALRQATENYMQALVQEALRNGERQNMEDTQEQTALSERDIEELLNEVQRLSEQGRHAEAQQMLQMLANLLQNLEVQIGESESGEGNGEGDGDRQMQQSMDQLSEALGDQRSLRDQTQQAQEQGQSGSSGDQLAQRQAEIRQGLAEAQRMSEQAGGASNPELNAAADAMRRAEDALRRGDFEGAENAQSAALENLREGADALAAEMRARSEQRQGQQGEQGQAGNRDPLGRTTGGADSGDGTNVPGQSDPARARQIFDEIRRRAQDPNRPEAEREYLRRLLDRFGDS
jgi:hypothetical protein